MWNWQQKAWPAFSYNIDSLQALEERFLYDSGHLLGAYAHFGEQDQSGLMIELMSNEALKSSAIEGEILNRDSLQSSIRRNFGLPTERRCIPPAEQGMSDMMLSLYRSYAEPLNHAMLFDWHTRLMAGRSDVQEVGCYRIGAEPMQVVSNTLYNPRVHFEAPPSARVAQEMDAFVHAFNATAPGGSNPLPALTRAGLAHLYFVSIHPFEDGNGRIARALSEKVLAQSLKQPALIALSQVIEGHRKEYYRQLALNNRTLQVTAWLRYFSETVLEACACSQGLINFLLAKTRLYDRLRDQLNARQEKALERMFREGPEGFKGGLSAENYIRITDTSRATATRDLQHLVDLGALTRTGMLKGTRYWLNLS